MIRFICDSCSAIKSAEDTWILGLAAESRGVTAARREVTILPVWDNLRAVHALAVHFCSLECKENYLASLFGHSVEDDLVVERVAPVEVENVMERTSRTPVLREKRVTAKKGAAVKSPIKARRRRKAA